MWHGPRARSAGPPLPVQRIARGYGLPKTTLRGSLGIAREACQRLIANHRAARGIDDRLIGHAQAFTAAGGRRQAAGGSQEFFPVRARRGAGAGSGHACRRTAQLTGTIALWTDWTTSAGRCTRPWADAAWAATLTRISSSVLQTHRASQPGTTSPHANDFTKAPYIRQRTAPPYFAAGRNPAVLDTCYRAFPPVPAGTGPRHDSGGTVPYDVGIAFGLTGRSSSRQRRYRAVRRRDRVRVDRHRTSSRQRRYRAVRLGDRERLNLRTSSREDASPAA